MNLDLRDYFAGQALIGIGTLDDVKEHTTRAYEIADAMLAARKAFRNTGTSPDETVQAVQISEPPKQWVGLTLAEANRLDSMEGSRLDLICVVEQVLRGKNT